jgi:hypothetical protein
VRTILQHDDPCAVEVPVIVIIQSTADPLHKDLATFLEKDSRYRDVEDCNGEGQEERKVYRVLENGVQVFLLCITLVKCTH